MDPDVSRHSNGLQASTNKFSSDLESYPNRKDTSAIKLPIHKKSQKFGRETFRDKLIADGRRIVIYLLTYLLTYLLNPWSRVLLEKLASLQLVKKFSAFYGNRIFINVFTRNLCPFLS